MERTGLGATNGFGRGALAAAAAAAVAFACVLIDNYYFSAMITGTIISHKSDSDDRIDEKELRGSEVLLEATTYIEKLEETRRELKVTRRALNDSRIEFKAFKKIELSTAFTKLESAEDKLLQARELKVTRRALNDLRIKIKALKKKELSTANTKLESAEDKLRALRNTFPITDLPSVPCPVCDKVFSVGGYHTANQKLWEHMSNSEENKSRHVELRDKMFYPALIRGFGWNKVN